MRYTGTDWVQLSDGAILKQIGNYIRQGRLQQNKTQAQLAEMAGLNRWTISQIENGESVTLTSLIQILRAMDNLFVLDGFEVQQEISPLEYARLKKQQKKRVRNKQDNTPAEGDPGW
jgi:transcriptional regulator with XRE-family HTH domain